MTKYSMEGVEEWKRDNLVYTGQSTFAPFFPVGIEQIQESDENGSTVSINKEVMDVVVIVEYRTPSLEDVKYQKEQIVSLNA